eukprot:m51a1_g9338 hypothetical protein (240) ;mRNA; r:56484-57503
MPGRYKCLVIDHDDTAVDSTPTTHFPAHLWAIEKMRPGAPKLDFADYKVQIHHYGIGHVLAERYGMSDEEITAEYKLWREFVLPIVPKFFDGFGEMLRQHVANGGCFFVASLNEEVIVREHYDAAFHGEVVPSHIYGGCPNPPSQIKPSPWIIQDVMRRTGLAAEDIAVLDDGMSGINMARAAGVTALGAGWSHDIEELHEDMRKQCDHYFTSIEELSAWLGYSPAKSTTPSHIPEAAN